MLIANQGKSKTLTKGEGKLLFFDRVLRNTEPVIIIGMHRSGTTLVTRLLHSLGVHMGMYLSQNAESRFFQEANRYLLTEAYGSWFDIQSAAHRIQSRELFSQYVYKAQKFMLSKGRIVRFFYLRQWMSLLLRKHSFRWGWKDPRNSVTLPIWLEIFPNAKVIHVIRNGIDVAISLHRREISRQQESRDSNLELRDFHKCFSLWEQYVKLCKENSVSLSTTRYMEIHYETVLQSTVNELKRLVSFLNFDVCDADLAQSAEMVDPRRLDNEIYRQKYQQHIRELPSSKVMEQLCYTRDNY